MSENTNTNEKVFYILIVDDEKEVLNSLCSVLKPTPQFKTNIVTAENGEKALSELEKQQFDLVLTDQKMPGMTGVELLTKVKERYPNALRMLITGFSDLDTAKEAINKAYVNNYIEKPWDNNELKSIIYAALQRKVERDSTAKKETDNVAEALHMVEHFRDEIKQQDVGTLFLSEVQKIRCEFASIREFNQFSFEIKKYGNVSIDDVYVFENKYIITVSILPPGSYKIR